MDAHLTQHPASTTIVVQPSLPTYVERLAACHQAAYGYAEPGVEDLTAEKFAQHLAVFPAGQFMALEVETDQIVGLTASMRIDFDPQKPTMRSWGAATHFG